MWGPGMEFPLGFYGKGASKGDEDRVVVKRLHSEGKDVGSNPAATEKRTLGDPPTEGSPMVQQDLSGRPAI